MSASSKIEWTDATWNPIVGCSIVSPGCTNCYAMRQAPRTENLSLGAPVSGNFGSRLTQSSKAGPVWTGQVRFVERRLMEPLGWKKPKMIFVNSMGDLFHESIPYGWIDKIFAVMALCPQHTFQVLTKRAERMRKYLAGEEAILRIKRVIEKHGNTLGPDMEDFAFFRKIGWTSHLEPCKPDCAPPCEKVWASDDPLETRTVRRKDWDGVAKKACDCYGSIRWDGAIQWPLPNVWLGVSAERQEEANERIPLLMQTPAAVRFISAEPLLGPIELKTIRTDSWLSAGPTETEAFSVRINGRPALDWVIVGGESGPGVRLMQIEWAESIIAQCRDAGVACFVKQLGSGRGFKDRKGGDPSEWPEQLRVRQFPTIRGSAEAA